LAFLKHLFTMAITWGKVAENPVKRVKRIHEPHGHTRCLTPAEEDRLLDACNPHLKPVVIAALHTGCRQSELLSLRCANVDIPRRLVTVHAAYAKDREPRSITMDAILLQTLEALPRADDPQALVFGYRDVKQPFR
jgi:integrase